MQSERRLGSEQKLDPTHRVEIEAPPTHRAQPPIDSKQVA
jgi:hypothetical protein